MPKLMLPLSQLTSEVLPRHIVNSHQQNSVAPFKLNILFVDFLNFIYLSESFMYLYTKFQVIDCLQNVTCQDPIIWMNFYRRCGLHCTSLYPTHLRGASSIMKVVLLID